MKNGSGTCECISRSENSVRQCFSVPMKIDVQTLSDCSKIPLNLFKTQLGTKTYLKKSPASLDNKP